MLKIPYGKEGFLGWGNDNTNLDLLLGEYTCIEVELSDDETVHSTTEQPSATCSKTYKCSECPKTYSSISGLRGHLNKKHGILNVFVYEPPQEKTSNLHMRKQRQINFAVTAKLISAFVSTT